MEFEPSNEVNRQTRLARVGSALAGFFKGSRDQLRTADLNLSEGSLRSSIAPTEYLEVPDFPPMHDDTIISEPE